MTKEDSNSRWQFNRQINLSVIIQLFLLASLIVGSWVNLQQQLYLLQHDVNTLLNANKQFQTQLKELAKTDITHDYRLRAIEKTKPKYNIADGPSKKPFMR